MWIRCDINLFFLLGFILFYVLLKQLENDTFPSNKRDVAAIILSLAAIIATFTVGVITL